MKRERLMAVCVAGGLALIPAAQAVSSGENPYKGIVTRNPFGLIPPPPPAPAADTNPPPANLKLTGITTILGMKNALLVAQEPVPGKPPQYYMLTEGQREGAIEILTIDSVAGSVKVSNAGSVSTLTFDKDGLKSPASAPAPAAVSMPAGPGAMPGRPAVVRGGFNANPGGGGGSVPEAGPANPGGGLRQIPTRSLRMPVSSAQLNQPNAPAAVAPEVQILSQAVQMEVNKRDAIKRGDPAAALYPDTSRILDGPPAPGQ